MDKFPITEVTFEKFVYGGDVLGRLPDGRVIFVSYGLPGETARVRVTEEKRRYARGEIVELLSTSVDRIAPRCRHFSICGGCSYQHIDDRSQWIAKDSILREQLSRVVNFDEISLSPVVNSTNEWHYRNHMQFQVSSEGKLGFHISRSKNIIPIEECHLPVASINAVWPLIELHAGTEIERISVRAGIGDELQIILESEVNDLPEILIEGLPVSVVHQSSEGVHVIAGSSYTFIDVLDRSFRVSAGSFFQVNTQMAGEMVKFVLEQLQLTQQSVFLDLYCGVGLFSLFVALLVGRLVAVEESPFACEDFVANLDAFDHVELYEDKVENVLQSLDVQADVILVDPPRSGLHRDVVRQIMEIRPKVIVYISCDPSSLARDASLLVEGGYVPRKVALFDLFPQTHHIESISIWDASN